jgi:hypothetical protein
MFTDVLRSRHSVASATKPVQRKSESTIRALLFYGNVSFDSGDRVSGLCKNVFSGGRLQSTTAELGDSHTWRGVHVVGPVFDRADVVGVSGASMCTGAWAWWGSAWRV